MPFPRRYCKDKAGQFACFALGKAFSRTPPSYVYKDGKLQSHSLTNNRKKQIKNSIEQQISTSPKVQRGSR